MSSPAVLVAALGDQDRHDPGSHHPEHASRLPAAVAGIAAADLGEAVGTLPLRRATRAELLAAHDEQHIDALERFIDGGGHFIDGDTRVSAGSWDTALLAAGSGMAAIEALDRGEADAAFVAVRPPGHHASADRAMGFCLLNNVAVAAANLARRGERVAIIDWDVHHGNGTQDIFWDDPRVLYASTHQFPAYPGTMAGQVEFPHGFGRSGETGGGGAPGLTINVPLPRGATGDVALAAFDEVIAPAVDAFSPTWVLISAGFDAHRHDPLADLDWSAGDFADLARRVAGYAPRAGRVIAFLEGGYDLDALALSTGATVAALADVDYRPEPATSGGPGREVIDLVRQSRAAALST